MNGKLNFFDRLMMAVTFAEAGVSRPGLEEVAALAKESPSPPRETTAVGERGRPAAAVRV